MTAQTATIESTIASPGRGGMFLGFGNVASQGAHGVAARPPGADHRRDLDRRAPSS